MTEEEEIEHELLDLEIYRELLDLETYRDGLDYEWSKKPILVKVITKIRTFVRDLIWKIKKNFTKEEDPPF